jgi:signal transduction histidine kinase
MASSISHDLRHSLAAIVANAEFLCESRLSYEQREELYQEVRVAVNQMTDLIDSLLEFSRTREALRPTYGKIEDSVQRAMQGIRARPEFHHVQIDFVRDGKIEGWFDPKKLERALYNLLLNACEAVAGNSGRVKVSLHPTDAGVEIRIGDNGPGIAEAIRDRLFQPFISHGKENGTGLGLTVVQKIVQDHGGDVMVEETSPQGTVFKVVLPLKSSLSSAQQRDAAIIGIPPVTRAKSADKE